MVEDDAAVRLTAVQMLEKCGYTVFEASDAEEALQLFEARRQSLSLLITDVVMPGMSGPELADTIAKTDPDTRVLYMTGYADEEVLSEPLGDRKVVLLKKPFSLASIIEKIGEALEGKD